MTKSNSVETETHTGNQVRYKIFTELSSVEDTMDSLLKDNDPGNVQKIVIQPRNKIEEYTGCSCGTTRDDDTPLVKNKPWIAHDRLQKCSNL